jgi:hypothetical protein
MMMFCYNNNDHKVKNVPGKMDMEKVKKLILVFFNNLWYILDTKRLGDPLTPAFGILNIRRCRLKGSLGKVSITAILVFHLAIVVSCILPFRPSSSNEAFPPPIPSVIINTNTSLPTSEPPIPGSTETPLSQPTSPSLPSGRGTQPVNIFLIALEDNGASGKKIGCNDSVVPVEIQLSQPPQALLRGALEALLAVNTPYYGGSGLYHSLYQSNLKLENLLLDNGEAVIRLKGDLKLGGVCDNPRLQAQLEETALQFSTVHRVKIFINDIPLEEILSGQG